MIRVRAEVKLEGSGGLAYTKERGCGSYFTLVARSVTVYLDDVSEVLMLCNGVCFRCGYVGCPGIGGGWRASGGDESLDVVRYDGISMG